MPTADLSTHPVTTTPYGRWQALNAGLGVTAFGINAIVCDPGETIDTEHDEAESGQEEAYIVVAGSGRITLDGEIHELRPWDVVRISPSVVRALEAGEDGLEYIAIGSDRPEGGDGVQAPIDWPD